MSQTLIGRGLAIHEGTLCTIVAEGDDMKDIVYGEKGLPLDFAGGYVAWLGDEVIMTADSYDGLCRRLDRTQIDQARIVIGYVEPANVVRVY